MKSLVKRYRWVIVIWAVGFLIRLAISLPGLMHDPQTVFWRLDSSGYVNPGITLLEHGFFGDDPAGGPTATRAPGMGFLTAGVYAVFGHNNIIALALVLILINSLLPVTGYLAGRAFFNEKAGLIAAVLLALNLTAIAQAPLLLSDSLFAVIVGLAVWQLGEFYRSKKLNHFLFAALWGGVAALVRPINMVWIYPALLLLLATTGLSWQIKLKNALFALLLFYAVLFPWMARNREIGSGFCIDTNTGAMYYQNGAMILAEANKTDYEVEKQTILDHLEQVFADKVTYDSVAKETDYKLAKFKEIIFAHPVIWIKQHFNYRVLLPDAPSFFEVLGVTKGDKGTMNVMKKSGVWAAVNHYFDGKAYLLLLVLPLLLVTGMMYLLAAWTLGGWVLDWKRHWFMMLCFLALAEYYFFLPGPIGAPRYQMPALIFMAVMAANAWEVYCEKIFARFIRR